ncbi:MAG: efflux RND transporter periplasmic adaptor subunit [Acidobacteriaceae bacterium]
MSEDLKLGRINTLSTVTLAIFGLILSTAAGCGRAPATQAPTPHALPVKVETVELQPVPLSDNYVATIKSRRSATIQPRTSGNLTQIFIHSGELVRQGQRLMEIDPKQQQAVVAQQQATEQQALAVYQFNQKDIVRQKSLFSSGITSKQAYQQAQQTYNTSKATYESDVAAGKSAQQLLVYYHISAPFSGIVGDVPVHVGDYVSPTTILTTVDENTQLEAYIYIPADRAAQVHVGLPVEILGADGKVLDRTKIYFVSPQVDTQLQAILVKAKVHASPDALRNAQLVRAVVIWSTAPAPTVPVLAVTQIGGQQFVYVAEEQKGHYVATQKSIELGSTVGNSYEVKSGLQVGDKVIVSGIQFLVNGAPVQPIS